MNENGTPVTGPMVDDGAEQVEPLDGLGAVEMASMFLGCSAAQRAEAFLKTLSRWKP